MRPTEHLRADSANDSDVPLAAAMTGAPVQPGSLVDLDDLSVLLAEDEPELAVKPGPVDAEIPMPEELPSGGDPDRIARVHHYMVCWRPGSHPVQGDVHRNDDLHDERSGGQHGWGVEGDVISFRFDEGRPVPLGHDRRSLERGRTPRRGAHAQSPRSRV